MRRNTFHVVANQVDGGASTLQGTAVTVIVGDEPIVSVMYNEDNDTFSLYVRDRLISKQEVEVTLQSEVTRDK